VTARLSRSIIAALSPYRMRAAQIRLTRNHITDAGVASLIAALQAQRVLGMGPEGAGGVRSVVMSAEVRGFGEGLTEAALQAQDEGFEVAPEEGGPTGSVPGVAGGSPSRTGRAPGDAGPSGSVASPVRVSPKRNWAVAARDNLRIRRNRGPALAPGSPTKRPATGSGGADRSGTSVGVQLPPLAGAGSTRPLSRAGDAASVRPNTSGSVGAALTSRSRLVANWTG
jgi:hypothetical protein